MPRAPVGILFAGERVGERAVGRSTLVRRSGVVDRRAYERVPERDRACVDADEPGIFRRLQRGEVASRRRIGGCGDEQCATRLWRQAAKRAPHGALDALGSGQVIRKGLAPDAFSLVEQRERPRAGRAGSRPSPRRGGGRPSRRSSSRTAREEAPSTPPPRAAPARSWEARRRGRCLRLRARQTGARATRP